MASTITWWGAEPRARSSSGSIPTASSAGPPAADTAWLREPFRQRRGGSDLDHLRAAQGMGADRVKRPQRAVGHFGQGAGFGVQERRAERRAARAEAASAAGQSLSPTSTTACGRVAGVRPGYTGAGHRRGVVHRVGAAESRRVPGLHAHGSLFARRGYGSGRPAARGGVGAGLAATRHRRREREQGEQAGPEGAHCGHTSEHGGHGPERRRGRRQRDIAPRVQASLPSASVPPENAESLTRCQGTGDPDCWGESHGEAV